MLSWINRRGRSNHDHHQVPGLRQPGHRRCGAHFVIDKVAEYPKNEFPTEQIYGDLAYPGLRLITCGGDLDRKAHSYLDNIVVYAHLTGST